MRTRKPYWTPKRLIELRVASRKLAMEQLIKLFSKPEEEILQAQLYERESRRLKQKPVKEKINGKTITITRFSAEFARGAKQMQIAWYKSGFY